MLTSYLLQDLDSARDAEYRSPEMLKAGTHPAHAQGHPTTASLTDHLQYLQVRSETQRTVTGENVRGIIHFGNE